MITLYISGFVNLVVSWHEGSSSSYDERKDLLEFGFEFRRRYFKIRISLRLTVG